MTVHLSILLALPAAGGALGALAGGRAARWWGLAGSLLALAYAIVALVRFHAGDGQQFMTDDMWISAIGVHWKLAIDGLNLGLVVLSTGIFSACTLWATSHDWDNPGLFYFWLGLAHSSVLGALLAQDLLVFVIFFDLMLVPFLFLAGIWSPTPRADRIRAILKLFVYTLVGSLLMLAAAIATAVLNARGGNAISFAFSDLSGTALSKGSQEWIFLFFAAAFLIKMPAFPFHGWMPDGYVNMPMPVVAVFSAVLSKVAAYGFLQIALPLFPQGSQHFQMLLLLIGLASILYGSAMAFTTTNTRLVLGYSSMAQLGFIVLGIFSLDARGAQGALLQAFNHGLVVAPAFFLVALAAARSGGSEDLRDMGGIAFRAPLMATVFLIVALANLAMPGTSNFAGEFLILLGVFKAKIAIALIASVGVVLASAYSLRLLIRAMHNRVGPKVASHEISLRDGLVAVPLVLAIVAIALYPQFALHRSEPAVDGSLSTLPVAVAEAGR
ncbi:MAG TPA: NADH-quinone oxidoreductase subunit M [Solirubrobacteraceae bacterium]|nr:NADH-quinone oxidoreductase subunit M [Solirubrobacteraceae bacterium]